MKLVGLTGGIAAGKSEVTQILLRIGIPVFDSDAAVHVLYQNGMAAKYLEKICPQAVINGNIDRQILSKLVLENPSLLKKIEVVIHPLVREMETAFINSVVTSSAKIAVIDSALLIETGHYKDMDFSVLVTTSRQNQIERAMQRPHMTLEKVEMILAKQLSQIEKRKYVDFVIENNGTLNELESKVKSIFGNLI